MSMGLEIVQKLEALGLGTYKEEGGGTIFLDELPDDPNTCIAVFETGGAAPEGGFGQAGIKYENPTVVIWCRGEPYMSGPPHNVARQAYIELAKIQAEVVSGTEYLTVTPLQPPFVLRRDDNRRRVIWAFNLLANKVPS